MSSAVMVLNPGDLLIEARSSYGQMQRSWYYFAKSIHQVKKHEAYLEAAKNFKEYAETEFPTMEYTTLLKFVAIVEEFGDQIDAKLKKDKDFSLPAYESCYRLTSGNIKDVPREELTRLKKAVLDGNLSYHALMETIKCLVKKKIKSPAITAVSREEIEQQLAKDIAKEVDGLDDEDEDLVDLVDDSDEDAELDALDDVLPSLTVKARFLVNKIPDLWDLSENHHLKSMKELGRVLSQLSNVINDYLAVLED